MFKNTDTSLRGNILMDLNTGRLYDLVRESRPVTTTTGTLYGYNLRNRATGKMRRTTKDILFTNDPMNTAVLRRHFGLDLEVVTDSSKIAKADRMNIARAAAPAPRKVAVWRKLGVLAPAPRYARVCPGRFLCA